MCIKEEILNKLKFHKHIYITAHAGRGKTRLLREVCKTLNQNPVSIDVSKDYNKSFLDHVLTKLLNIEREYLALLPEENIVEYLSNKSIDDESVNVLLSYIKGKSEINYDLIINFVTDFFLKKYKNKVVLIDNIHNFSLLDFKLFKSILDENDSTRVICTARDNEINDGNLKLYLNNLIETNSIYLFDLQSMDTAVVLKKFIGEISSDQNSVHFLRKYQTVENFQQFIIILKNLKVKGILHQTDQGKVYINESRNSIDATSYSTIYQDIIQTLQKRFVGFPIEVVLRTAATYGYRFPIDLLEEYVESTSLLDELILNEVLVIDEGNSIYLKFDHELTREIIYNSIPQIQRNTLHKRVIIYLESLENTNPTFSYRQLCYHNEAIKNFVKSAEYANKEGHNLIKKSESSEAYTFFEMALKFINSFNENNAIEV